MEYDPYDVFDIVQKPLRDTTDVSRCTIELSLNYPPTKRFMLLPKEQQKAVYNNLVDYLTRKVLYKMDLIDSEFEECESGKVHYHSMWSCTLPRVYSIEGMVMDLVRILKSQMIYSHKLIHDIDYHSVYHRYRDAMMCIQWRDITEKRSKEFLAYIRKTRVQN